MTLQAASPRIEDFEDLGFGCSTIVVATQSLPRHIADPVTIFLCDLRPLLRGFVWRTVHGREMSATTLLAILDMPCPAGYQFVVSGVPQRIEPTGQVLLLAPGRCVVVELAVDPPEPSPENVDVMHVLDAPTDGDPASEPREGALDPHEGHGAPPNASPHLNGPDPAHEVYEELSSPATVQAGTGASVRPGPWVDKCSRGFYSPRST